jgi:hypothetical protein
MGLSLLNPAALFGLGLLALPILAHLTGYREVRKVDFPTLRFLESSLLKVRRRRRMEALLLLFLRCAAIVALVLLFAQPLFSWKASALSGLEPSAPTLILVDISASMGSDKEGSPLLERARQEAVSLLEGLDADSPAGLVQFDSQATLLGPGLTTDRGVLGRELERLERGDGATYLTRALRRGRDALLDAGLEEANLFVLSDGTAIDLPLSLSKEWPQGYRVHYHDLLDGSRSNRWTSGVKVDRGVQRGSGITVEATVREVGETETVIEATLNLPGGVEVVREVQSDQGEGARLSFSLPVPPDGTKPGVVALAGDDMPADDRFPFVLDGDTELEVLLISGDGGSNPREDEVYYLERALEPGAGSGSRVRPRVVSAEEVRRINGGEGTVVFLANVTDPAPLSADLTRLVQDGGGLFISVGGNVDPDSYNELLSDLLPGRFTEVKTRGRGTFETAPVGLSVPRLDDEEFRVFRSGGTRGFSRVGFGKVLGIEPRLVGESRVLLRYSDGLPALLERRVGAGRVVLFTSSIDDDWTDFPLRAVYVPLMHQFARSLSGSLLFEGSPDGVVGDKLRLPVPRDRKTAAWVETPEGKQVTLDPAMADSEDLVPFDQTKRAGHYSLVWDLESGPQVKGRFSVRVPEEESQLQPLDSQKLMASIPGLVYHRGEDSVAGSGGGEVVRRASLNPLMIGLLLFFLLSEVALAGRRT